MATGRSEAARLEELRRTAEEDWLDARLDAGDHRQVAAEAEAMVNAEPLRERRWASLALAQYRCARQADALRSLAGARHVLVEQLGLSPGPELTELEAAILRQDPALGSVAEPTAVSGTARTRDWPRSTNATPTRSSVGTTRRRPAWSDCAPTRSWSSPDRRDAASRRSCAPGSSRRCVVDGREVLVVVPGTIPARRRPRSGATTGATVVVVDQFEELFELGHPPDTVDELCRSLVAHADSGGDVVVAIRSDRLGELGVDAELSHLVERGLHW